MKSPFFTSLLTGLRLSAPASVGSPSGALFRAIVFFTFAGWLVSGIGLGSYWLGTLLFPSPALPILLSLLAMIWVTGARPEAGLARVFDGFGDERFDASGRGRLGARGVIALGMLLAVKFYVVQSLFSVETFGWPVVLKYMSAHSLSRLTAATVLPSLPAIGDEPDVKKRAATSRIGPGQWLGMGLFGLAPLLALVALTGLWIYLTFLIPLALLRWRIVRLAENRTGSDAGDWLGATQQLGEVIIYLSFVSLLWVSI